MLLNSVAESLWQKRGSESPFFKEWFGSSVARYEDRPLVLYASLSKAVEYTEDAESIGIILSPEQGVSSSHYSDSAPFYVKLENPCHGDISLSKRLFDSAAGSIKENLKSKGHDGILFDNGSIVVFSKSQLTLLDEPPSIDYEEDLFPETLAGRDTVVTLDTQVPSSGSTKRIELGNIDSSGSLIHRSRQALHNFWRTFYGTKAVDEEGRPLRLYHSTNSDFSVFETNRISTNNYGLLGDVEVTRSGIFLTPDIAFSQQYLREGEGQNVMPVYLNIQNPLDLREGITEEIEQALADAGVNLGYLHNTNTYWEMFDNDSDGTNGFVDCLKEAGFDGAIFPEDSIEEDAENPVGITYVAFSSEQIKSALGNRGTFDPNHPDIRYRKASRGMMRREDVQKRVNEISVRWRNAPEIDVIQSVSEAPFPIAYDAAGVFYQGKVILIADNLANLDHSEFVLLHEVIGHYGLAGVLGDNLDETMAEIYRSNKAVRMQATAWMQNTGDFSITTATEEVLSDLAAKPFELSTWDRVCGLVAKGIRALGFDLPMSDADVRVLLFDARRWVERGRTVSTVDLLKAKYRKVSQTAETNLRKWFGKSKVASEGRPQVVYHATNKDFSIFNTSGGTGKTHSTGAFFTDSVGVANTYAGGINGGRVMPVYLRIESPAEFFCEGRSWNRLSPDTRVTLPAIRVRDDEDEILLAELTGTPPKLGGIRNRSAESTTLRELFPEELIYDDDFASTDDLARWARKRGYDGAIFHDVIDQGPSGCFANEDSREPSTVYVCYKPEQIKSAIGNNGDYSLSNPDIKYKRVTQEYPSVLAAGDVTPIVVYHGTPNGYFDKFDSAPAYFSDDPEVAWAYAYAQPERECVENPFPYVVTAHLAVNNPKYLSERELLEILECENIEDIEWSDVENLSYEMEEAGYDAMVLLDVSDFAGFNKGSPLIRKYNQIIVFDVNKIKVVQNSLGFNDPSQAKGLVAPLIPEDEITKKISEKHQERLSL